MQPPRLTLRSLQRLYTTAQGLLRSGQAADAAHQFERIAHARVRKPRGAAEDAWERENPLVAQARLGLCLCYLEQGLIQDAMQELERVLELDPDNAEALCEKAYIYCLQGKRDDARCVLECAVERHPESARAHKSLGLFYLQEDDIERAIQECRAAVQCDPSYDPAHVELAVALSRAGRFEDAVRSMVRAVQLAPKNPDYYYSLAALLRETRRLEDARGILHVGLCLEPHNDDLLEAMAELQLEIGEPEQAIEYAQRLLRRSKKSLAARDVLGVAYLQQGRINEALRMADQMVTLNPLDPSHHFKKAVLFQQQGMTREALDEFMQVRVLAWSLDLADDEPRLLDSLVMMAEEARQAIESMDNHQMRQIILLASEDPVFRARLRRDAMSAAGERGFFLSDAGLSALQSLDFDGLASYNPGCAPVMYH